MYILRFELRLYTKFLSLQFFLNFYACNYSAKSQLNYQFQTIFNEPQNPVSTYLFNACQCCLACFESFLQYLGKNAYIIITLNGSSFCPASKRAFHILSTNSLRVVAINSVGDFVLLLGKVFVVLATVLIGIEMIQVTKIASKVNLSLRNFIEFQEQTWPTLHLGSNHYLRHFRVSRRPLLSHGLRDDHRHNFPVLL